MRHRLRVFGADRKIFKEVLELNTCCDILSTVDPDLLLLGVDELGLGLVQAESAQHHGELLQRELHVQLQARVFELLFKVDLLAVVVVGVLHELAVRRGRLRDGLCGIVVVPHDPIDEVGVVDRAALRPVDLGENGADVVVGPVPQILEHRGEAIEGDQSVTSLEGLGELLPDPVHLACAEHLSPRPRNGAATETPRMRRGAEGKRAA
mmetsp:Transcript_42169/g.111462  ORF Transcript_42169/g.111462 Transcript_42169/m.111462 type:complete len:208 (-) Transcript_42169:7-630(-)